MVYLGLGSNVGDRLDFLRKSVAELRELGEITQFSSVYETLPWGKEDQASFLNACIQMNTELEPNKLLYEVKQIEDKLGRIEREHWGPREIDIDILFYDDLRYLSQRLTIPHPLLHERAFVLVPMAEIAPNFVHPALNLTIAELNNQVVTDNVVRLETISLDSSQ